MGSVGSQVSGCFADCLLQGAEGGRGKERGRGGKGEEEEGQLTSFLYHLTLLFFLSRFALPHWEGLHSTDMQILMEIVQLVKTYEKCGGDNGIFV